MKPILAVAILVALSGCASLNNAGTAEYVFKDSVVTKDGATHTRGVTVRNGKEIAELDARISKTPDGGYVIDLRERGVKAFDGQAIASGAMKTAIRDAVKPGIAAALLPVALPAAGAILASPGLAAAAVGVGATLGVQKAVKAK